MRRGLATPERNLGRSLTIPVKTRTPIEAFRMLQAGQPVDQALAYYVDQNGEEKDLFMMDRIEKLHAIAKFKAQAAAAKAAYEADYAEYVAQQNEQKAAQEAEAEKQRQQIISDYLKTQSNAESKAAS